MRKQLRGVFFICFFLPSASITAQKTLKLWTSAAANISFSRKLDLRITHLKSFSTHDNFSNGFNQSSLSLDYDLTKHFSLLGGSMYTTFPSSGVSTTRIFARFTYKVKVAKLLYWSNSFQAEKYSVQETRYRNRVIYISRISNKERIKFLHLTLSAAYWLHYNIGGNELRYFDKTGAIVARQSPDGLHRGRLFLTATSKLNSHFSFSLYYMNQKEFNLFTAPNREMNIINPINGKISRPFDNYNVAGVSLLYDINLYKSKKQKANNHSENY